MIVEDYQDLVREFWQSEAGKFLIQEIEAAADKWQQRGLATVRSAGGRIDQARYEIGVSDGVRLVIDALKEARKRHHP